MMTKFNVGDEVRVTTTHECVPYGTVLTVRSGPAGSSSGGNYRFYGNNHVILGKDIELVVEKPKKSARITALESQVATLQAKVEALEKAGKYPLTERFNQEAREVDAILADIERKAKPTLEALLATYPTPNQQRADVIKRAKAYLEEVKEDSLYSRREAYIYGKYICDVEFHVNSDKRTVVAVLRWRYDNSVVSKGIAKCGPDDVFNADIGKAIALARALGVDVPVEFVKAVQPTEVVVGMVVSSVRGEARKVASVTNVHMNYANGKCNSLSLIEGGRMAITDDTDAVYS